MADDEIPIVAVHKTKGKFCLDSRDKVTLFSLLLNLWNRNKKFFVHCELDSNGRIVWISDRSDRLFFGLNERKAMLFCSGNGYEEDYSPKGFVSSGYEDLLMGEFASRQAGGLPFLKSIDFYWPLEKFTGIVSWLYGNHLPKLQNLAFSRKGPNGVDALLLMRMLDSRLLAQIKNLGFHYDSGGQDGNGLAELWVETLPRFINLEYLGLPGMKGDQFVRFVDRLVEEKTFLSSSLKNVSIHGFGDLARIDPNEKRAIKKFLSTFQKVKHFCGYSLKDLQKEEKNRKRRRQDSVREVVTIGDAS